MDDVGQHQVQKKPTAVELKLRGCVAHPVTREPEPGRGRLAPPCLL